MNKVLRVELIEEERRDLDHYILIGDYGFGHISRILRRAVREFIKTEKEKELAALLRLDLKPIKEAQSGSQGGKGKRTKKA